MAELLCEDTESRMSESLTGVKKLVKNTKQCPLLQLPSKIICDVKESNILRQSQTDISKRPSLDLNSKGRTYSSITPRMESELQSPKMLKLSPQDKIGDPFDEDSNWGDFDLAIEGAIVDDILETRLPRVVSEVSSSEKGYTQELSQLEEQVLNAAADFKAVEENLKRITEEVRSFTRQIYVSDDDIIKAKREIARLENEISQVTHDKVHTEYSIAEQHRELVLQQEQYTRYQEKMSSYRAAVEEAEMTTCPIYEKLESQKRKIESLKANMTESESFELQKVYDGTLECELKAEIQVLQEEEEKLEASSTGVLLQITVQKENQKQLTQDVEVLHKRNAAMLRRLKRQLRNIASNQ